jgi:PilZ domain
MDHRYLSALRPGAYHFAMDPSPKSQERRGIRYSLNLPVSLTLAHKKFHVRSESISLGGIRLSSASFIPEGSLVEVEVCIAHLPQPGTYLSARGKVIQVKSKTTGDFAVAVAFERPIQFSMEELKSGADFQATELQIKDLQRKDPQSTNQKFERSHFSPQRNKFASTRGQRLGSAWFMET